MGLNIYEPILAQKIIDTSFSMKNTNDIFYLGIMWLLVFLLKYILNFINTKLSLKFSLEVTNDIQMLTFKNMLEAPMRYFKNNSIGYIMSRQTEDVLSLEGMMLNNVISSVLAGLEITIIMLLMFHISFFLSVMAILIKGFELFINFYFPLKLLYKNHNEAKANVEKELQDILYGIKLIKISNNKEYETIRYGEVLKLYYQAKKTRDTANYIRGILSRMAVECSNPIIIIIGGVCIYQNIITIGDVMAFMLYFQKVNSSFGNAASLIPLFKISQGAAERIYELVHMEKEIDHIAIGQKKIQIKDCIEFRNVCFSYADREIFNNLIMKIRPNQVTAIVGISGAGKSTIVNLLLRLVHESSGEILIDGKNINEFSITQIRESMSLLSQESILFHRSLRENITYHLKGKAIEDKISKALDDSFSSEIISRMPDGLDSFLSDRGENISGGEKQRICIARELMKNTDVFIFDEATSALDSISENIIQKTVQNLSKDKTIIIIAHRMSTIQNADMIYVLDDGKIKENGNHELLMNRKGLYYALYTEQKK